MVMLTNSRNALKLIVTALYCKMSAVQGSLMFSFIPEQDEKTESFGAPTK